MNEYGERLEKAKNEALHLFAKLGLTLHEVGEVINMIRSSVQIQSDETKIDPKLIQAILQQWQKQREEKVARESKAVFGDSKSLKTKR